VTKKYLKRCECCIVSSHHCTSVVHQPLRQFTPSDRAPRLSDDDGPLEKAGMLASSIMDEKMKWVSCDPATKAVYPCKRIPKLFAWCHFHPLLQS